MRYKINSGSFSTENLTVDFILNDQDVIALPWQAPHLTKGEHVIELSCNEGDSYNINIHWLAVTPIGASLPTAETLINSNLGAWNRCFDGQNGSCKLWDGLISKDGWFLLDDSNTALITTDWVKERPSHTGGYQDGYFFGYDYKTGLRDFYKITGNPPLLPKWAFGIWFSRYYSYHDKDYINDIIPTFRKEKVPLDVLVIDTDFKSPNAWNGWSWNNKYFQDPKSFMDWTKEQGLNVLLNIHPAINSNDPYFKTANATAKGLLKEEGEERFFFDFSNKEHAQAYSDLHSPFNKH